MEILRQRIRKLPIFMPFIIITSLVSMKIVSVPVSPLTAVIAAPVIVDTSLTPGSTFSIDITIAGVEKMWGHNFWLYYNTTLLTAISYDTYSPFTVLGAAYINDTAGWVFLSYNMPFGEEVGFSTVEAKPLAKITFSVEAYGTSALDIQKTILADVDANAISKEEIDGYFSNVHGSDYYELLAKYNDLLARYDQLNSTYSSLLANYTGLQTNFNSVQSEYNDLSADFTNLETDYNALQANYNSLETAYDSLNSIYNSLKADYDNLESKHEVSANELSTARNLNYLLVVTTIVFIATTAYLVIRKPKVKPT